MKRALLFIFMTVCVLGMSACSSKDAMPETSDSASNPVQNTDISNLNGGKIWSEQDIVSMFSLVQETDWEYIDCVLIPDHASDRVGAVLFRNDKEQTSNVAFFDADGYFQQYGTYDDIISWADMYDSASMESKKMIVSCLIRRVEVYRDYRLHIDFNIDFEQFSAGLDISAIAA